MTYTFIFHCLDQAVNISSNMISGKVLDTKITEQKPQSGFQFQPYSGRMYGSAGTYYTVLLQV